MEPYPDDEEQAEVVGRGRSGVIVALVIGVVLVVILVMHLTGGMALHGR